MGLFDFFKSTSNKLSIDLSDFKFTSSKHSRIENGNVTGSVDDCWRGIYIKSDPNNINSYLVTTYNLDENHSLWANNIQMAPKQMKIEKNSNNNIVLRGYGKDNRGNLFSDYGIILLLENNNVTKVILQMFDRNTELHYSK